MSIPKPRLLMLLFAAAFAVVIAFALGFGTTAQAQDSQKAKGSEPPVAPDSAREDQGPLDKPTKDADIDKPPPADTEKEKKEEKPAEG